MPWIDRTLDQAYADLLRNAEQALVSAGHAPTGFRIADNTILGVILREVAGEVDDLHGHIAWRGRQLFADTAEIEQLERHASEVGVFRKPAVAAVGAIDLTGVDGTVVPVGVRLTTAAAPGVTFRTIAAATIAGGAATVSVEPDQAGQAGNVSEGATFSFVTPIAGVDGAAVASAGGFTGGVDEEGDAHLLSRYLFRKRNPPRGGKPSDYVAWMLEAPGVVAAWSYPTEPSRGYVSGRFIVDPAGGGPIPTEAQVDAVQAFVDGHVNPVTGLTEGPPAGMEFRALRVDAKAIDLTIALGTDTAAVRAAVEAGLKAQLLNDGAPGRAIRASRLSEAISRALGENHHRLEAPAADVALGVNEYPTLGAITWEAY